MTTRACRYCKSPARGNPCWWFVDHPDHRAGGGDPPCACDCDYDDRDSEAIEAREWRRRKRLFFFLVLLPVSIGIAFIIWG